MDKTNGQNVRDKTLQGSHGTREYRVVDMPNGLYCKDPRIQAADWLD